jgi:hypothetical protein
MYPITLSVPTTHDGGVGRASCLGEQDEREDSADEGEGAADAECGRVVLSEDTVDWTRAERDDELNREQQVDKLTGVPVKNTMACTLKK